MKHNQHTYWYRIYRQFKRHYLGVAAFYVIILFILAGVYAPFLASSKPIFVLYDGVAYFPLFRYLLYNGFYTKGLDIFFNILIFTLPLFFFAFWLYLRNKKIGIVAILATLAVQVLVFLMIEYLPADDPASDPALNRKRYEYSLKQKGMPMDWPTQLSFMTPYAKLNMLVQDANWKQQNDSLLPYEQEYAKSSPDNAKTLPTLWQVHQDNQKNEINDLNKIINEHEKAGTITSEAYLKAKARLKAVLEHVSWLNEESAKLQWMMMPLLSHFHWEDDAGGQEALNRFVPWWQLTRINRKDLLSALIFGIRISLVVGIVSVSLALMIGIPIGAFAGYYGGTCDIVVSRLLEIWESMPTFFMLLMIVGILQSKSIFLVIAAIGLFGWTGFSRYVRGEFFKQRNLPYVEACRAAGFRDGYIMFKEILPNAIPPVLALLPFAIMGAVTSEAGLSFLGLGEEGSCSWGVLMDEGRTAFPEESYLLWPPAILLTVFLVAIALVGDSLRDCLDPKLATPLPDT